MLRACSGIARSTWVSLSSVMDKGAWWCHPDSVGAPRPTRTELRRGEPSNSGASAQLEHALSLQELPRAVVQVRGQLNRLRRAAGGGRRAGTRHTPTAMGSTRQRAQATPGPGPALPTHSVPNVHPRPESGV